MKFKTALFLVIIVIVSLCHLGFAQSVSRTNFSGVVGSGARALGMGGAFIAVADDATAASWNPGGLGQLERPEFSFVLRNQSYSNMFPARSGGNEFLGTQDYSGTSFTFDFASFTFPFRIGDFKIVPQISYQRAVSFDITNKANSILFSNTSYDAATRLTYYFKGRFKYEDVFSGGFDTVSFCLGSKIMSGINFGFSINIWMNGYSGTAYQHLAGSKGIEGIGEISTIDIGYTTEHSFDISGVNMILGALIEPFDGVKIGIVYKSAFDAEVEYDNLAKGQVFGSKFTPQTIEDREFTGSTTLEWPMTFGAGLSIQPEDQLTFSFDYTRTMWSDAILKNFNNAATEEYAIDVYFPTMKGVNSEEYLQQIDTEQFRFGFEYIYLANDILIPFRFGIFTDSQYFKDASNDKIVFLGITGGLGIKAGPVAFDVALLYESGDYLDNNNAYSTSSFEEIRIYVSTIISF
ncbi:MAG: hypothetical protein JW737_01665 [Acidobacteria bacterium]|nr:hypothetical protein [Acidobacteriota bacterium]